MRLTQKTYTTPGAYSWLCPAGITTIIVYAQGGGGGGGGGAQPAKANLGGPGGVATFLVPRVITVIPNTTYSITIGSRGAGGTLNGGQAGNGGETIFGSDDFWIGGAGGWAAAGLFPYQPQLSGVATPRAIGYSTSCYNEFFLSGKMAYPISTLGGTFGTANPMTSNVGLFDYVGGSPGVSAPSTGGAGAAGNSSDAGRGGNGGNGGHASGNAQDAPDAPATSYGAGGGGGGGSGSNPSFPDPGYGGDGAGGRMIITWFE